MKKICLIYTRVFDPFLVIAGVYLFIFSRFGSWPEDLWFLFLVLFLNLIIPVFYFTQLIRQKKVGNWDVTDKKQRRKVFGPLVIFIILSTLIIYAFSLFAVLSPKSTILFRYLLKLQIIGILLFLYLYIISPYFKSSGHVGTMSSLYPLFLQLAGVNFFWVIIFIVFQAVSRLVLKKHTLSEVTVGFITGLIFGCAAILFL